VIRCGFDYYHEKFYLSGPGFFSKLQILNLISQLDLSLFVSITSKDKRESKIYFVFISLKQLFDYLFKGSSSHIGRKSVPLVLFFRGSLVDRERRRGNNPSPTEHILCDGTKFPPF